MPVTADNLDDVFTHHPPDSDDIQAYSVLRSVAKEFALAIIAYTPVCGDQQAAIRHVREAVMTANAARALRGAV